MRVRTALFAILFLAASSMPGIAQTTGPSEPRTITLTEALATAAPPDPGQVVLTVGGDRVKQPSDAAPIGDSTDFPTVAADFDRISQSFGMVSAIAPPTMILLNVTPSTPNIYAGLSRSRALPLLLASLSDPQWKELTSEAGMPVSELTAPLQAELLGDLLPPGRPVLAKPEDEFDPDPTTQSAAGGTDISAQIPQSRLRMGASLDIIMPVVGDKNNVEIMSSSRLSAAHATRYEMLGLNARSNSRAVVYGQQVRAEVPNVPKQSQLDYSSPSLSVSVPLNATTTVGKLVTRIGMATGVELYADRRLETQMVTTIGAKSARAADLLQALALCVTGTYRQVGPAFVLTDDIVGIGTRIQLWRDYEVESKVLYEKPVDSAIALIARRHSPRDLKWLDDPAAFSPDEVKLADQQANVDTASPHAYEPWLEIPLSQATAAQQEMIERAEGDWNSQLAGKQMLFGGPTDKWPAVSTDGKISFESAVSLQMVVPGLGGPVDMSLEDGAPMDSVMFFSNLPHPPAQSAKKPNEQPHPRSLNQIVADLDGASRRAVIVHSRTAAGVDADLSAMKSLGLNEMWLDVFSSGTAHIPGSTLSKLPHPLQPGEHDILTEAVTKGKSLGISVYPVIDLLYWGDSPPVAATDFNILGETSAQAAARWWQLESALPAGKEMDDVYLPGSFYPDFPGVAVAPAEPLVREAVMDLTRRIARSGAPGMVLRDTDPPGYDIVPNNIAISNLLLGYTVPMRLAFLRTNHADPVDVYPTQFNIGKADTSLPELAGQDAVGQELASEWIEFRREADIRLLRTTFATAASSAAPRHLQILVKQRRRGEANVDDTTGAVTYTRGWYGSWDNPSQPPPTLRQEWEERIEGGPADFPTGDEMSQAREQSSAVLLPVTNAQLDADDTNAAALREQPGKQAADGFVLDLADSPFGDNGNGSDPLTDLASNAAPRIYAGPAMKTGH